MDFSGYHGTDFSNTVSIIKGGFTASKGDDHWLGDGIYFFLEGLSKSPETHAENWTIAQSWDKQEKKQRFSNFVIFEAKIEVKQEECLDLRTADGVEIMSYLVDKFIDHIHKAGRRLKFMDGLLINLARNEDIIPMQVVIGNFFIKFSKERIERINLRTANCTICNVFESNPCILSYKVRKTGALL